MKALIYSLLLVACANASGLAEEFDNLSVLPDNYSIKDVTITIVIISGGEPGTTTVVVDGIGKINLQKEVDGDIVEEASANIKRTEFLRYLQELYEMNFFDFDSEYPNEYRMIRLDGDTIRFDARRERCGEGAQIVHCKIGNYEKCVMTQRFYPIGLWQFGNRIESDARRILGLPQSKLWEISHPLKE